MEIRHPSESELPALKETWKTCFGDPDEYIDFYFQNAHASRNMLVCADRGRIAAMMTLLPVLYTTSYRIHKGAYIYAVATMPDYRKQGLMTRLDSAVQEICRKRGYQFMSLVPATKPLFEMYEKIGYHTAFRLGHHVFQIKGGRSIPDTETKFSEPNQEYFLKLRQLYLSSLSCSVQFDGYLQEYMYLELQKAGYHILGIQNKYGIGYLVYRVAGHVLEVREAGLPYECFAASFSALADRFRISEIHARLAPQFCTDGTEGESVPYGMIKSVDHDFNPQAYENGYMNLMLD